MATSWTKRIRAATVSGHFTESDKEEAKWFISSKFAEHPQVLAALRGGADDEELNARVSDMGRCLHSNIEQLIAQDNVSGAIEAVDSLLAHKAVLYR